MNLPSPKAGLYIPDGYSSAAERRLTEATYFDADSADEFTTMELTPLVEDKTLFIVVNTKAFVEDSPILLQLGFLSMAVANLRICRLRE